MLIRIFHFFALWSIISANHYKGGTITWKPVDPYTNATMVPIIITQSHWWTLDLFRCNQTTIDNLGFYNDRRLGATIQDPWIACESIPNTICAGFGFSLIRQMTFCTDFNRVLDLSSGSLITRMTFSRNTNMVVGYESGNWATEILNSAGANAGGWRVITRIDLTQKYPINSSPVTGSLPIIRVIENETAIIQIPAGDWDLEDDIRCRWASSTSAAGNECGDICANIPGANISLRDCTITWYAQRRSFDRNANRPTSTYVAAIMVEDFANMTSTVPMSSVPLQMLIFVYQRPAGSCHTVPNIIGDRPNRACIGVPINVTLVERVVGTVYCTGDFIQEFVTISPLFMRKTAIAPVPGTTNQWFITLTWTPTDNQKGPQVFCAAPIDQRNLTGPQHCVNFVVGYAAPNLIVPTLVQGSASPLGTVFANHSLFSVQATGGVYHPNRNGTFIRIFNKTNPPILAWETDCGYSPDCIYSGQTVLFIVRNANWVHGATYFVTFDSGAASGNVFCAPESAPITDPNFWNFNIWDPSRSSTTSTTTTPPTTATITTRGMLTTTPNANLTTTGVVVSNGTLGSLPSTVTTTSSTISTTVATTASMTSVVTVMDVLSTNELEAQCRQPLAITTAGTMVVMGIVHAVGMFSLFTKIEKMFNPARLEVEGRRIRFFKNVSKARK